jgi:uncharacterized protein (DUF488 family)
MVMLHVAALRVHTVGHSTRTIDELIVLLEAHGIERLADVRTAPGSRRHPQFGAPALEGALAPHGIAYRHFAELGGRRRPMDDSPNAGWLNSSFRGYADHMLTSDFERGLAELLEWARVAPAAMMCAEAVWWRCHRRLVADALTARGVEVRHILSAERAEPHELTAFARVEGERVTYLGLYA